MKDELFDELVESVRQGGAILRGDLKPSRWYQVKLTRIEGVKSIGTTGTDQKKLPPQNSGAKQSKKPEPA